MVPKLIHFTVIMSISSAAHRSFHYHKFTITEWNSRCVQAWESGIHKGRWIWRQKQLWDLSQSWISVLMLRLGAGAEQALFNGQIQWNNCWGIEPEGVCCLDIFVREILARERLTAHSLWKETLPLNIWGRRMIGTASLIAKHLLYRIFSKIHGYITLNCSVVHKLYDSKVNKGVEWKAAIPNIPMMEREQAIIQYRKSLTYENCWTPKAEGTVQGSLISWAFYLKKVLIIY